MENQHADNEVYLRDFGFSLTYVTRDPDDTNITKLDDLPFTFFETHYVSENLHHYRYTIYI